MRVCTEVCPLALPFSQYLVLQAFPHFPAPPNQPHPVLPLPLGSVIVLSGKKNPKYITRGEQLVLIFICIHFHIFW